MWFYTVIIYFFDTQKSLFAISGATFALLLPLDPATTMGSESIIKFLSKFILFNR